MNGQGGSQYPSHRRKRLIQWRLSSLITAGGMRVGDGIGKDQHPIMGCCSKLQLRYWMIITVAFPTQ